MNNNTFPRRTFFKVACMGAAIPLSTNAANIFSLRKDYGWHTVPDLESLRKKLTQKDPLIWLFTGDSITQGAKHTHGCRSYPEVFAERIRWELQRVRDIVVNTGISGNTTQNILDDFNWRIRQFNPAVVALMIGTNDCSKKEIDLKVFEQNLDALLLKIRESGAITILQTPNPIIKEKAPERARIDEYVTVIQEVAEKNKTILVDHWTYWQDTLQNRPEVEVYKNWLNDPLHPNATGHLEMARLIFKELSIFDPNDPTCGGEYYEGEH